MSHKKQISISFNSEHLKVLLTGDPWLVVQQLRWLHDKDLESVDVFLEEHHQEIGAVVEDHPHMFLHIQKAQAKDYQNAHIAYILTDDDTDRRSLIQEAKRHKIIIVDQVSKSNMKEKLIFHNVKNSFPATRKYHDPYDALEYMTQYTKMAKIRATMFLSLIGIAVFAGLFFLTIYEFNLYPEVREFLGRDHSIFYWMLLLGFVAEMVAGSMGMGYGTICTAMLLFLGQSPAVASASIHSAQTFTTAAGAASHFKLKNINFKLVKALAPYAILGALVGSFALYFLDKEFSQVMKPILSLYTLSLGLNIFVKTLRGKRKNTENITRKKSNLPILGVFGGFLDSFAGGGWGPLVTGSLIKDGRTPRYVVGSSTFLKFLLTTTSAISFVLTLGTQHWNIILGLLLGGVITAPFSAMLTARLPIKKMTLLISVLVIVMSCMTLYKVFF